MLVQIFKVVNKVWLVPESCFCAMAYRTKRLWKKSPLLYVPLITITFNLTAKRHTGIYFWQFCKSVMPKRLGFTTLQTWPTLELALASKLLNTRTYYCWCKLKKMFWALKIAYRCLRHYRCYLLFFIMLKEAGKAQICWAIIISYCITHEITINLIV